MAKKKKYVLTLDEFDEFDLIGLCSHFGDYRLVWNINTALGIHLKKAEVDYIISDKKGEVVSKHSMYTFNDGNEGVDYYLLKNNNQGKSLIPEANYIDYFLFLQNNQAILLKELAGKLKEIQAVLAAYIFDPQEFDSAKQIVLN